MVVVDDADPVLEALPEHRRPRLVGAHHVLHLGRVAEPPHPPPQRVQLVGPVALPQPAEAAEQLGSLLFPHGADTGEYDRRPRGPGLHQPAEVVSQAVDVEVQHAVCHLRPAARPRGAQTAQERPLLGRGRRPCREAVLEEAEDDVHVPAGAEGAGELAQHLEGPAHAAVLSLARQQRQRHAEAPARHANLVDGLFEAGHGPRQLPEDAPHPVLQQEGGPLVGDGLGGHGFVTG